MKVGGNGEVYHNGKKVKKGKRVDLRIFDRVVIGGEVGAAWVSSSLRRFSVFDMNDVM